MLGSAMEFADEKVAAVFAGFPADVRAGVLALRRRIFAVAAREGIVLEEALRWGQPAYLTPKGTTIRLGQPKTGGFALYTHCQTTVMADFRAICPDLAFEGNRAVHFGPEAAPPDALDILITRALTYHL